MARVRSKRFMGIPDEFWIGFVIMVGFFLKLVYDIKLGYTAGTMNAGVWRYLENGDAGRGHIGYIQYFFTYHRLPDFDPREMTCYSNPPFYYAVCALILEVIHRLMGWAIGTSLHVLQCINVIYVMVGEVSGISILQKMGVRGRKMVVSILFLIFFPTFYNMGAALNASAMSFMFTMLAMDSALSWYRSRRYGTLVQAGIRLGLGMMCSLTSAMAVPAILVLLHNAALDGRRNTTPIGKQIRTFLLTAAVLGLWWPVYRLIRFGVPLWYFETYGDEIRNTFAERLAIPNRQLLGHLHLTGNVRLEYNIWAQTFKTAIVDFDAIRTTTSGTYAITVFAVYLSIAVCLLAHVMLVYSLVTSKIDHVERRFVVIGYLSMLFGYLLTALLIPWTGTMDFKYLSPILIFPVTGIALCGRPEGSSNLFEKVTSSLAGGGILLLSLITAFLYGFFY